MGTRNGIFALEQVYRLQTKGDWSVKSDVWLTPSPFSKAHTFGYFAGSPSTSTVDRIDYTSDTATALERGPLTVAKSFMAGTGNANFGYFGGGYTPTVISTVDRIDYSNDNVTASPKGPLSLVKYGYASNR